MNARFEIKMRPAQRRELEALAGELDMSAADLARLGITWVLRHRNTLLGGEVAARKPAAAEHAH